MKLGLFTAYYEDRTLDEVCAFARDLGYDGVELACWHGSRHLDAERAVAEPAYAKSILDTVSAHGLEIGCVSNHLDGQLVLGPYDRSTDDWSPASGAEEKLRFAIERSKLAPKVAAALEVETVAGFVGSHVWGHWYNHDPQMVEIYEEGWDLFAERWNPILDEYRTEGVRFALEVHPVQIAYNIETAARALEALDHRPEFGFNFDPSHLVWQLIDPCLFVTEFADRIYHAHAKDTELVARNLARSGILSGGPWERIDRGVRFRCPGWGDIDWHRLVSALFEVGYDGMLAYEHEDPIISADDAAEKCVNFLRPLVIDPPTDQAG
ncbi:MAG: sugar phosphate isomerase/epimerase [bacterium]